jgi:hypothetical protein
VERSNNPEKYGQDDVFLRATKCRIEGKVRMDHSPPDEIRTRQWREHEAGRCGEMDVFAQPKAAPPICPAAPTESMGLEL